MLQKHALHKTYHNKTAPTDKKLYFSYFLIFFFERIQKMMEQLIDSSSSRFLIFHKQKFFNNNYNVKIQTHVFERDLITCKIRLDFFMKYARAYIILYNTY